MPRQNTSPANYPQAVLLQIEQLAQNIVIARKRRNESQAQWAKKLGVSQPTMARIERGDPSVAMASYVMCMWLINQAGGLADLIAPLHDHAALEKEVAKVRTKRKPRKQLSPSDNLFSTDIHNSILKNAEKGYFSNNPSAAGLSALINKTDAEKSLEKALKNKLGTNPLDDIHNSILKNAEKGYFSNNPSAAGLSALINKTDAEKSLEKALKNKLGTNPLDDIHNSILKNLKKNYF